MIYNFKIKEIGGNEISMNDYKGKVLLIVNTATGCGFTPQYEALQKIYDKYRYKGKVLLIVNTASGCGFTPQYEGLQKIYDEYKDKGFEILDFPCNQFFEQAPGSDEEIVSFCQLKYNTTFKTFSKIDVNGENASDLYKYLRNQAPKAEEDSTSEGLYNKLKEHGFTTTGDEIKWNFTKFLVDRDGNVVKRYSPTCEPEKIEKDIESLLK